jgi:hypothetical protein
MRLVLTRGEVDRIVCKHLRETGKIPEGGKIGSRAMAILSSYTPQSDDGYLGEEKGEERLWANYAAFAVDWTEPE